MEKVRALFLAPSAREGIAFSVSVVLLLLLTQSNFLLFHTLSELFTIVIGISIFIVTWNSRHLLKDYFFLFIGTGFLFVSLVALFHTLTYKGLAVLAYSGANVATQLWLLMKIVQTVSLLFAFLFIKRKLGHHFIFLFFLGLSVLGFLSIFTWKNFPVAFVEGGSSPGLTSFKIITEYAVSILMVFAGVLLFRFRKRFDRNVYFLSMISIVFIVFSEVSFTTYASVFGFSNKLGHVFELISFYFLYKAFVQIALNKPLDFLFADLKKKQEKLSAERNRAKENEKNYMSLFNNRITAIAHCKVLTDKKKDPVNYVFLEVNKAFEEITGLKRSKVIGKKITDVIPGYEKTKFNFIKAQGRVAFTGKPIHIEEYHEQLGRWYSRYIFSPKKGYIIILFFDITEKVLAEEKKSDFVNIASHELKTPVSSIKAFSQLLEKRLRNTMEVEIAKNITRQANKMVFLINEFLNFGRIQDGKLDLNQQTFDINEAINKVIKDLNLLSNNHQIVFSEKKKQKVTGDRERIEQVLVNLLTNAIKYSSSRGKIYVETEKKGKDFVVSVADSGKGIPKREQDKVFQRFYRVRRENDSQGFGLGLYISKEIIQKHGGRMWVESEENKGSKFYFSLPQGYSQTSVGF